MPLPPASLLKILVVDDDRSTRMLLKAFLGRQYAIVEAVNGKEAIEVFDRENPDLILMDVTMPEMTGYEAATIIKLRCGNHFVPIIFLTGLNDDEALSQCVKCGGDDFLSKPFNRVLLNAKITSMQRISQMHRELEDYKNRTDEEIEFTHHVFNALTKRMSGNIVTGLDHWALSAGHFSGDLMIYDKSASGKLYLLVGDFTGHGFSAAIGALPTSDVFFAMTQRDLKPADILAEINRKLREIMPTGHFCATVLVCCDPATRQVEIFNGGLPPVLILDAAGNIKSRVISSNLALGVLPASLFSAEITQVENITNTTLLIYSDGVTDAQNATGEMFGDDRLHAALSVGKKPFDSVKAALEKFIGNRPPEDDISLITLRL